MQAISYDGHLKGPILIMHGYWLYVDTVLSCNVSTSKNSIENSSDVITLVVTLIVLVIVVIVV